MFAIVHQSQSVKSSSYIVQPLVQAENCSRYAVSPTPSTAQKMTPSTQKNSLMQRMRKWMMNSITTRKTTSSKNRSLQLQTNGSFRSHHKIKKFMTNILYPEFIFFIFARLIREYVPIHHRSNMSKKFVLGKISAISRTPFCSLDFTKY